MLAKLLCLAALALSLVAAVPFGGSGCQGSTCKTTNVSQVGSTFTVNCEGTCPSVNCGDCTPKTLGAYEYCRCNTTTRPFGASDECVTAVKYSGGSVTTECIKLDCSNSCAEHITGSGTPKAPYIITCQCP